MTDEGRDPLDPMKQPGADSQNDAYAARSSDQGQDDHSAGNRTGGNGNSSTGVMLPATFQQLDIPTPPMLEMAIGYGGPARFVAFYWGGGDESYFDDGRLSATADWQPYLLFVQHRAVWHGLVGYDFGSSDAPARHYLVLDREQRRLFAAPANDAGRFLLGQWPQPSPDERALMSRLTPEDFARINAELAARVRELMRQEIEAEATLPRAVREAHYVAMAASQQLRHQELQAWLDAIPDDGRAGRLVEQFLQQLGKAPEETEAPEE